MKNTKNRKKILESVDLTKIYDPIEAIKFRMTQLGMKQKDLAQYVGFKSRVSEILSKKRKLSLEMIRNLSEYLRIPTEVLIQKY